MNIFFILQAIALTLQFLTASVLYYLLYIVFIMLITKIAHLLFRVNRICKNVNFNTFRKIINYYYLNNLYL